MDTANWEWQQWAIAISLLLSLIINAALHGRPRAGDYNGFAALISFGLSVFILGTAGFFA